MADNIWTLASGLVIRRVSGSVFRCAQPKDLADWEFVRDSLGVDTVVKLNAEFEGSDKGAIALGLNVHDFAIQPIDDGNIIHEAATLFEKPDMTKVDAALETMAAGGCLVHCTHGHDRTGLLCAIYRVRYDGWTTTAAWEEAMALGYHPEFIGLDRAWWDENAAGKAP